MPYSFISIINCLTSTYLHILCNNQNLLLKVAFCNEFYTLCQSHNVDYSTVSHLATNDKRIGASHSMVPVLHFFKQKLQNLQGFPLFSF